MNELTPDFHLLPALPKLKRYKEFGSPAIVTRIRHRTGLTVGAFATFTKLSRRSITYYEANASIPRMEARHKIMAMVGLWHTPDLNHVDLFGPLPSRSLSGRTSTNRRTVSANPIQPDQKNPAAPSTPRGGQEKLEESRRREAGVPNQAPTDGVQRRLAIQRGSTSAGSGDEPNSNTEGSDE